MVSIKTALLQNDLRAEFMQDIPDQRDQDVLFGAVVPVKGRPGDACAVYKLWISARLFSFIRAKSVLVMLCFTRRFASLRLSIRTSFQ